MNTTETVYLVRHLNSDGALVSTKEMSKEELTQMYYDITPVWEIDRMDLDFGLEEGEVQTEEEKRQTNAEVFADHTDSCIYFEGNYPYHVFNKDILAEDSKADDCTDAIMLITIK